MRKIVEISEEVYQRLMDGKCVDGSMRMEKPHKLIVFKNYKRTKPRYYPKVLLGRTDFGAVYKTKTRHRWSESMPSNLGAVRMARIMERDCKQAQEIIATAEIIDRV